MIIPFHRLGKGGTERLRSLPKVTKPGNGSCWSLTPACLASEPMLLTTSLSSLCVVLFSYNHPIQSSQYFYEGKHYFFPLS